MTRLGAFDAAERALEAFRETHDEAARLRREAEEARAVTRAARDAADGRVDASSRPRDHPGGDFDGANVNDDGHQNDVDPSRLASDFAAIRAATHPRGSPRVARRLAGPPVR